MTHLPHVRRGRTRDLSQERLAGPDQARGWDDFGCNHTKSTSRLVTQLTSRSSRARFAVSDRTGPQRAGRLNSGVRSCRKDHGYYKNNVPAAVHLISCSWTSLHCQSRGPRATWNRVLELLREMVVDAHDLRRRTLYDQHACLSVHALALVAFQGLQDLTIRSSRARFAASCKYH